MYFVLRYAAAAACIFIVSPSYAQQVADPLAVAPDLSNPTIWTGSVGCSVGKGRQSDIVEASLYGSSNDFGAINQKVGSLAATWGHCISERLRTQVEGSVALVDEEGRKARSALVGIGIMAEITPNLTLTPMARIGIEDFGSGRRNFIYNASITAEAAVPIAAGAQLIFVVRPDISARQIGSVDGPSRKNLNVSTSQFAATGFDFSLSKRTRSKIEFAYQHYSSPSPITHTGSIIGSTRLLTRDGERYTLNLEIWYTRGSNGYKSGLVGLSYRFGQGK